MGKVVVTAADLDRADRLLVVLREAFMKEPQAGPKELACLLAEIREEAILCATVRVERMFEVEERKQLRLPTEPNSNAPEGK